VTSIYSTSTLLTTVTTPVVSYATTTETLNSTVTGTQTKGQLSLTTVTSTYTMIMSGTQTTTVTMTVTQISSQTMQLLGNVWGEALALVAFVGAVVSYLIPKVSSRRAKGIICKKCGYLNPPFARAHCVKCGNPLKES
jgi:ribosomal protein L40E